MGVESYIRGEITCDGASLVALSGTSAWEWFQDLERDLASEDGYALQAYDVEVETDAGAVPGRRYTFDGWFRNLSGHLVGGLGHAAAAGHLTGWVEVECQDGSHYRERVEYTRENGEARVHAGSSDCLVQPLILDPVRAEALRFGGTGLTVWLWVPEAGVSHTYAGGDSSLQCACGGYEDLDDEYYAHCITAGV